MSGAYPKQAIKAQEALVSKLKDISALVEVSRANDGVQQTAELGAVAETLMIASNDLFQLHQEQTATLDKMSSGGSEEKSRTSNALDDDGVVSIAPLIILAEKLQHVTYANDTTWFLASKLYQSFETWQEKLEKLGLLDGELAYWLAYESFHCAEALLKSCSTVPDGLQEIHNTMQVVMKAFAPSDLKVGL